MHFHRIYVEITNICGLACNFCPPGVRPAETMTPAFFKMVLEQLRPHTRELALHVMGDPLTISNLSEYLDLAHLYRFRVKLTTSGYHLKKTPLDTLFHPAISQVNISLNSYNKNRLKLSLDSYMEAVFAFCSEKLARHPEPFINLRLWNLGDDGGERDFNSMIFERLEAFFNIGLDGDELHRQRPKSLRLAPKILLNFESYFQWPSLDAAHDSDGPCHGLRSQIGVLADGTVVPCCLDGNGVISLGNINERPLKEILGSARAKAMVKGFSESRAVEELCRRCSFKDRFSLQ